jgi:hypothetical protein
VLQVKNGQLFWAADETIVQKQLAPGRRWVKVGDTYVDMSDEEAQHISAAIALKNTSILSEFRDELYPLKAKIIEEGDRVYVRPLCKLAKVTDINGERYEVAVSEKIAGIYWAHELETR